MFSIVSVCLSVCPQGGSHVTITHDTLDLTGKGPPQLCPLNMFKLVQLGPPVQRPPGGQDWGPVQTCPLEDAPSRC